jgi:hypothetical protein
VKLNVNGADVEVDDRFTASPLSVPAASTSRPVRNSPAANERLSSPARRRR